MPPKKSATLLEAELSALRDWVLAHQGALAARASDRPGLRGRLRQHWSEEEKRWYHWLNKWDCRFEADCAHLAPQRRALDELATGPCVRFVQPEPVQTPAKRARLAVPDASPKVAMGTPHTPAATPVAGGMLSPTVAQTIARSVRWTPATNSPGSITAPEDLFRRGCPAVAAEPWPFPGIVDEATALLHPDCQRIRPVYDHIRGVRRASGDGAYRPTRTKHAAMHQRLWRLQH